MLISVHRPRKTVQVMMNNVPDRVHHFLDIEAQVDGKEDDGKDRDGPGPDELTLVFSMSAL
jgi:hypothetical protein